MRRRDRPLTKTRTETTEEDAQGGLSARPATMAVSGGLGSPGSGSGHQSRWSFEAREKNPQSLPDPFKFWSPQSHCVCRIAVVDGFTCKLIGPAGAAPNCSSRKRRSIALARLAPLDQTASGIVERTGQGSSWRLNGLLPPSPSFSRRRRTGLEPASS